MAEVGDAVRRARERGQVARLPDGAYGALETVSSPLLLDGTRPTPSRPAPALGEHTAEVLREAGFTRAEIRDLLAAGAVRQG